MTKGKLTSTITLAQLRRQVALPLALSLFAVPALVAQDPGSASTTAQRSGSQSSSSVDSKVSSDSPGASPGSSSTDLPEAPQPQITRVRPANPRQPGVAPVAPLRAKYIPAGWKAQPLGVRGKIEAGATDLYSIENFGAVFLSAGYEQVLNSQPNYGTDRGAFGERLGAAFIRETSQGVFTDMVFSPLLHEDPRYYQLGPEHNVVHRTLYAITRPLITRTDSGGRSLNGALLLGYAASAALTPTFYPPINRNFHDTVSTYGGSIGGAALGFFVSEFSNDLLEAVHLKSKE